MADSTDPNDKVSLRFNGTNFYATGVKDGGTTITEKLNNDTANTTDIKPYAVSSIFVTKTVARITTYGKIAVVHIEGKWTTPASSNVNIITGLPSSLKSALSYQLLDAYTEANTFHRAWITSNGDIVVWTSAAVTNTFFTISGSYVIA